MESEDSSSNSNSNSNNNKSNWSERVEDLIESGHIDSAISLLETLISDLQTLKLNSPHSHSHSQLQLQLVPPLLELAKLYSSKGLSIKSDQARSLASAISLRSIPHPPSPESSAVQESRVSSTRNDEESSGDSERLASCSNDNAALKESSDDDWEAIADREPDELLSPQSLPEVSKLSLKDSEGQAPKRRGRGTFTYKKQGLYSDQQADGSVDYDSQDELHEEPEKVSQSSTCKLAYGTRHVLVLDGFHPSTTTTDLERLFENFKDRGFSIRWINDTLALAVFRSPSIALEACKSVKCSFSVRVLEEDDPIVSSIPFKDLDPPRQRPKTSAQTAQRLIAQELGVKLPSTFGSKELRKQETARKNRIITRQNLRDDAWGLDDP